MKASITLTLGALMRTITVAHCTEQGETRELRYWPRSDLDVALLTLDPFQRYACVRPCDAGFNIARWG